MVRSLARHILQGYQKTFNYSGTESRQGYLIFVLFQLLWFAAYLASYAVEMKKIALVPLLLFLLPLLACAARRINDAGYSRATFLLVLIAPYVMLIFLLFPGPKQQQR